MNLNILNFNWKNKDILNKSAKNTSWCLLGCSIGDFGTIYFDDTYFETLQLLEE